MKQFLKILFFFLIFFVKLLGLQAQVKKDTSQPKPIQKLQFNTQSKLKELQQKRFSDSLKAIQVEKAKLDSLKIELENAQKKKKTKLIVKLAKLYAKKGDRNALEYIDKGKKRAKQEDDLNSLANLLAIESIYYHAIGNYSKTLEVSLSCVELAEQDDFKEAERDIYENLGQLYASFYHFDDAIKQYQKLLRVRVELKDSSGLASTYTNLAKIYQEKQRYDSASFYYEKALSRTLLKDTLGQRFLLNELAYLHLQREDIKRSSVYFELVRSYLVKNNNPELRNLYNSGMGELLLYQKKYFLAKPFLINFMLSKPKHLKRLLRCYKGLAEIYKVEKDYPKSLLYTEKAYQLEQGILEKVKGKQFISLDLDYKLRKKEKQHKSLKEEVEQHKLNHRFKNTVLISIGIGLLFAVLLAYSLFYANLKNQKANKKLKLKQQEIKKNEKELKENIKTLERTQEQLKLQQQQQKTLSQKRDLLNNILKISLEETVVIKSFLDRVVDQVVFVSFLQSYSGVGVFLRNEKETFNLVSQNGFDVTIRNQCASLVVDDGLFGKAVLSKETQFSHMIEEGDPFSYDGMSAHGLYHVPIVYEEKVLGILVVFLPKGHNKNKTEILFLENITAIIGNTLNSIESREKIQQQNEELVSAAEELRQNYEELISTQESLEENQKELLIANAENTSINNALDKSAIISISDLDGNIIRVNDIFSQISGYSEEELIGQNQNIVSSGFHKKDFWEEFWTTISKGETWRGEIKNKSKSGTVYWVDAVVNPMFDEKGKQYRYLSILYPITEKKINEQKILKVNSDLHASIQYAQRIQDAFLVSVETIKQTLPDSFIFFKPRDVVSGDFYFFAKRNYKTVIAAVDCTGHGIPGAFMSLIGNDILTEIVMTKGVTSPDEILNLLRDRIVEVLKQKETNNKDGMDIAVCTLDMYPDDIEKEVGPRKLEYAGASNPLIYFQDGEMERVRADKIIIGGFRNYVKGDKFTKHTVLLNKKTTFYIFSDGIQDQFGAATKRKFSAKRLRNLLHSIHEEEFYIQKQILWSIMEEWQGKENQIDDMLLIGVRI